MTTQLPSDYFSSQQPDATSRRRVCELPAEEWPLYRLQGPPADERARVTSPAEAANLLMGAMGHLDQEELWVILLDTRNRVLGTKAIYKGCLNSSVVRVGEIFRPAIEAPAAAVIVAHNHPSNDVSPSPEDVNVTRQIVKAGKLLDVDVLDHLIMGVV
jgi:DNA repair protein RadC